MSAREQTLEHIFRVRELLNAVRCEIMQREADHDASKMLSPEVETFDIYTEKLKDCTYGSDEYKQYLAEMKPALDHHYEHNRHHPEWHSQGIDGMNLIDIMEMLADWKAAGERHANGSIARSLEVNKERFGLSDQLVKILANTVEHMEWGD